MNLIKALLVPLMVILVTIMLVLVMLMFSPMTAEAGCPQFRNTKTAPSMFQKLDKTTGANKDNGKNLFQKTAKPLACKMCHGKKGDGLGVLGKALTPQPRNFGCSDVMKNISPGQMFWIIQNGSKNTAMTAQNKLKPKEIWDIIKYIREDLK